MTSDSDPYPLHKAAREGNGESIHAFARSFQLTKNSFRRRGPLKGINDPKLSSKKDDDGRYAIHWAASSNNLDIVLLLSNQRNFDADVQDGSGWTPLMISASVPDSEAVLKLLLQKDADVNAKNSAGQTALHFVASKKNLDVARLLINATPPASTRVRDRRGQYPIHRAAAVGSVPMVQLLLKNRSPLNATDNEGYTPLHHAIAEGHGDTAVVLLKEGADHTLKNSEDILPLDLAPDKEVRRYIIQGAEREGVEL
ncbi:hypothetical protein S40285_05975 [Stachybotrys chlorohalonatus IBT 40285]|uniref:Uncharacterized protein n=1 Tax=Stachybotrys chlorohalonatus (strain IBT 40285) TaxID=1283841 RepID=A0A084QBI1_STAC4|nr:hypothetical protein S40285_05975 [Stachybotrys chlorohalonata IBT 40285]